MNKKIPKFKTESEAAEFWDSHSFVNYIDGLKEIQSEFPKPKKRPVPILLDEGRIQVLKQLSSSKGIGYGTLIRMWVIERLNKEVARLKHRSESR